MAASYVTGGHTLQGRVHRRLPGRGHPELRQRSEPRLYLQRRQAQLADAEPAGLHAERPRPLRRALRAGSVDDGQDDAAGRAAVRPRVELLAGTDHRSRRTSSTRRCPSRAPTASTTRTSRRAAGVAYDVFGNGKTAVKVNVGKYEDPASNLNNNYSISNPIARIATTTTRTWTDNGTNGGTRRQRPRTATSIRRPPTANVWPGNHQTFGTATPHHRGDRSQPAQRLGHPSERLADRRVGPAAAGVARLHRGRLLPPLAAATSRRRTTCSSRRPTSRSSASRRRPIRACPAAAATP